MASLVTSNGSRMSLLKSGIKIKRVLTPVPSCFSRFSRVRPTSGAMHFARSSKKLTTVRGYLANRIVEQIKWVLLHAVLDRFEAELCVSSRMCLSSVLRFPKLLRPARRWSARVRSETRWARGCFSKSILSRKTPYWFLGRDFHPAYLCRNSSIRPSNQLFEARLTLVGALNVLFTAEVASDLLHLNLWAVDVILSICWALGQPSRAASFSLAFSPALALADGFSHWTKHQRRPSSTSPLSSKGPWSSFTSTKKWGEALPESRSSASGLVEWTCRSWGRPSDCPWRWHTGSWTRLLSSECPGPCGSSFCCCTPHVWSHRGDSPRQTPGWQHHMCKWCSRWRSSQGLWLLRLCETIGSRFGRWARCQRQCNIASRLAFPRAFCHRLNHPMDATQ